MAHHMTKQQLGYERSNRITHEPLDNDEDVSALIIEGIVKYLRDQERDDVNNQELSKDLYSLCASCSGGFIF